MAINEKMLLQKVNSRFIVSDLYSRSFRSKCAMHRGNFVFEIFVKDIKTKQDTFKDNDAENVCCLLPWRQIATISCRSI